MEQRDVSPPQTDARQAPWWPAATVVIAFFAAAAPLILTQHDRGRGRFDQVNYHEPAILRFAEQLPSPDVSDYLSATTPAYHLLLALVARLASPSPVLLQAVGSLFTAALLGIFTRWLTPRAGAPAAAAIGLSLASSLYVFSSGVFLLPDNAAWLGVLGVLLVALRPRIDAVTLVGGGAVLLATVLTRQSHLWAAGVLWAAAWLGPRFDPRPGTLGEISSLLTGPGRRLARTLLVVLATLPAFAAVAWFMRLWGGLTVPIYHDYMQGANPATPAIILAQLAVIGVFHAGFWGRPAWALVRSRPLVCLALLGAGLILAGAPETTYSIPEGRFSGLWNISAKFPDIAGRTSTLLLVMAPAGLAVLGAFLAGLGARERWVMIAALVAFTAAVSMTQNSWQRYHEPMLLICAGLMSAMAARRDPAPGRAIALARWAGPALLACLLAAVTIGKCAAEAPVGAPMEKHKAIDRPLSELWPRRWDRVERHQAPPPEHGGGGA